MTIKRLSALAAATFYLLGVSPVLFQTAHAAEDPFSTTVKIVGYDQYLNGSLSWEGTGSGTLISEDGLVLTNAHVIMNEYTKRPTDAFSVCVTADPKFEPECRFTAELIRYDEKIDLALLQINEEPIWGSLPSEFPYLSYELGLEPEIGDNVTVLGYPESGGITIHVTQGFISGFEESNGYTYLKSDADIDSGNSGGTMLDDQGRFIGIPTYVLSDLQTVGRALDSGEVAEWVNSEQGKEGVNNVQATAQLKADWAILNTANQTGSHVFEGYPGLSIELPEKWEFYWISPGTFYAAKTDDDTSYVQAEMGYELFEYTATDEERLEEIRSIFGEGLYANDELIEMADGKQAIRMWDESSEGTYNVLYVNHGYFYLIMDYFIPSNDGGESQSEFNTLLNQIEFNEPAELSPPANNELKDAAIPFSLRVPSGWRLEKASQIDTFLAYAQSDPEGNGILQVSYWELMQGSDHNSQEEGLQYDYDFNVYPDEKVFYDNTEIVVDGLPGWMYASEYPMEDGQLMTLSASLLDPEYEFYFFYEGSEEVFETAVEDFLSILKDFKSDRYDQVTQDHWDPSFNPNDQGVYNLPTASEILNSRDTDRGNSDSGLTDIAGHPYEASIQNLFDMGVINGYADSSYKPDDEVNRAESLKIILQSLRVLQGENGEATFVMAEDFTPFSDMDLDDWFATYVAEGMDLGIVNGYPDGTFRGSETVNLSEALKLSLLAHQAGVAAEETDPWYQKYFEKAEALAMLTEDLNEPGQELTRGELAYIVDQLIKNNQ